MILDPFRMQSLATQPRWVNRVNPLFEEMAGISEDIRKMSARTPNRLPILRIGTAVYVTSDYQSAGSYHVMSFLIGEPGMKPMWDVEQRRIRTDLLRDGRRIGWKKLTNDSLVAKALEPFLRAANTILGLSATVCIHKDLEQLFLPLGLKDFGSAWAPEWIYALRDWKRQPLENMLRVSNFLSLFVGGLIDPDQEVLWWTDADEIAANGRKLRQLTLMTRDILRNYVGQWPVHLLCTTTEPDDERREYEDLNAVPDIIAGAMSELLTRLERPELGPSAYTRKATQRLTNVLGWFEGTGYPLKRLVIVIRPAGEGVSIRIFPPQHFRVALASEISAYESGSESLDADQNRSARRS